MLHFYFKKKFRLLTTMNFNFVFEKSIKLEISEMIILGRLNSLTYSRLGLSITKKNIRYAHDRNRLKRLIRESFRLSQHKIIRMDFIIIAKKNIMRLNRALLREKLEKLWLNYYQ
ncbi:ribonuclease P protein component [Buchnera aphidicola]|uniref:ribonuclease P protein component n=1 Tax=Buchnera aphidicola TaxID=9 RepID=UPI003464780B